MIASNFKKFAKTSLLLMVGQGAGQGLSLLRNVIIGHLLSPKDFGIASTFAMTVSIMEMASDVGSDQLLIQAKDGNNTLLQSTAQFFSVLRGLIICLFLLIAAPYIAALFKINEAAWAFSLLALVPLIRGLIHFDVKRFHREMNFFPNLFTELIPQLITCLLTFPIVWILKDYSAVINLILLQSLFLVFMSHHLSTRRYKITFEKQALKKIIEFGWPLLINGFLMLFIFQGDKFVIGIYYDMEKLGVYSAAFMMTMFPAVLISKVLSSLILPFFSKKQDDIQLLNLNYLILTEATVLIVSSYTVFFAIFGDNVLTLAFGHHYQGYTKLIASLGILWSFRILRVPATLLAMSRGDNKVALIANIFRAIALVGVFYFASKHYSIQLIAYIGCFGELLATLVTLKQIKKKMGAHYRSFLKRVLLFLLSIIASQFFIFYYELTVKNMAIFVGTFLSILLVRCYQFYTKNRHSFEKSN